MRLMHLKLTAMAPALVAAALLAASAVDAADPYPTRPVKIVVPYVAGGPTDIYGRLLSKNLTEILGNQFIVDN